MTSFCAVTYRLHVSAAPTLCVAKKLKEKFVNIIIWLVVGGLIGWVASILMGTNGRQGLLLNIVVGIIGAFLGGWLLGDYLGTTTINEGNLSVSGLMVSLVGAIILIAALKLLRSATSK